MSLIKKIKFPNENIYDIGAKWSNIDKENIIYNSSNIISFNTEQEQPLKSCLVNMEPIQEGVGEPSLENIRPIKKLNETKVFLTGKNLLTDVWYSESVTSGGIIGIREQDEFILSGTCTTSVQWNLKKYDHISEFSLPAGTYTLSGAFGPQTTESTPALAIFQYDGHGGRTFIAKVQMTNGASESTFTLTERTNRLYLIINVHVGEVCDGYSFKPMLTVGSSAAAFSPYSDRLCLSTLSTSTGCGGVLNVINGTLTITHKIVTFDGTETWGIVGYPDNIRYFTTLTSGGDPITNSAIFSHTVQNLDLKTSAASTDIQYGARIYTTTTLGEVRMVICLPDMPDSQEDFSAMLADWAEAETPLQVCYELMEPITYRLTPQEIITLAGQNYIWADTGNIAVVLEEFYSDIQNEITINLNENKLLYKNSNAIISSNHSITSDKLGINGDILNNYSLTIYGDTLTTGNFSMRNSLEQLFSFKFTKAGGSSGFIGDNLDIGWDWTDIDGSGIAFRSSKLTPPSTSTSYSQPGSFVLYARKPNDETSAIADTTELVGYPNGLLTWTKNGSGVSNPSLAIGATSASTYNLYVNGPSYIKSNLDIAATTGTAKCSLQYNDSLDTLNFVFD